MNIDWLPEESHKRPSRSTEIDQEQPLATSTPRAGESPETRPRLTMGGKAGSLGGMDRTDAFKLHYTVRPSVDFETSTIQLAEAFDAAQTKWHHSILDTRDKAIRKALIALGWTPPDAHRP